MAQGKRTREEDMQMVRELKIKDPQLSSRDISELTGISHVTVCEIIKELPELLTSSNKGEKILATMDEIIDGIADITRLAINPIRDKVLNKELTVSDLKALNDIAKNNFDRRQILTGKPTDIKKHEGLTTLPTEELVKMLG